MVNNARNVTGPSWSNNGFHQNANLPPQQQNMSTTTKKYLTTLLALSNPTQGHKELDNHHDLAESWIEIDNHHELTGYEERRCACSRVLKYGTTLYNLRTGRAVLMGKTCLDHFKGQSSSGKGPSDDEDVTPAIFQEISDLDRYSSTVLRIYISGRKCTECAETADRVGWCERCKVVPRCKEHVSFDCGACAQQECKEQERRNEQERLHQAELEERRAAEVARQEELQKRRAAAQAARAEEEAGHSREPQERERRAREAAASSEPSPDTMMCARCHRPVKKNLRCDDDSHSWYAESERVLPYSMVKAGAKKVVD